jgi:hypothetical protein
MNTSKILTAVACISMAASQAGCAAPETESIGSDGQPFATALAGEPVHEEITASGLSFLLPEIVTAIQAANVSVDVEFVLDDAHHFDDCNFTGGADVVRGDQQDAIAALDPTAATPESDAEAALEFGRWLHTTQDFYAHSNWVELGEGGLVDASFGLWPAWTPYEVLSPSGVGLVQGSSPKRTSVTRHADAPYPQDAIVRVKTGPAAHPGVMTGTVDYEPGNYCPPSIAMTHADLNKDFSDTAGREAQFVTAKALAVQQTSHEWCRLVSMTRAAWGDAGVAHLMTWASDASAASCAEP